MSEARRSLLASRIEEVELLRDTAPRKPNGHRRSCVCAECFEEWLVGHRARRAEFVRALRLLQGDLS